MTTCVALVGCDKCRAANESPMVPDPMIAMRNWKLEEVAILTVEIKIYNCVLMEFF